MCIIYRFIKCYYLLFSSKCFGWVPFQNNNRFKQYFIPHLNRTMSNHLYMSKSTQQISNKNMQYWQLQQLIPYYTESNACCPGFKSCSTPFRCGEAQLKKYSKRFAHTAHNKRWKTNVGCKWLQRWSIAQTFVAMTNIAVHLWEFAAAVIVAKLGSVMFYIPTWKLVHSN